MMDSVQNDLDEKGWAIIENALSPQDCDKYVAKYKEWLAKFGNEFPEHYKSLIMDYRSGHLEPSWEIRLNVKHAFAKVWGTEKLLSSMDIPCIGPPPEDGVTEFYKEDYHWLHTDQSAEREGLHCYQGIVYLETADEDDWCFHVLEGSHKFHSEFYDAHPQCIDDSNKKTYLYLTDEQVAWYTSKGTVDGPKRIGVPKGGLLLWDSRTIHANALPIKGRKHPGRWRYLMITAMAPAIWSNEYDLATKRESYEKMRNTGHWPSEGLDPFTIDPEKHHDHENAIKQLPDVALTKEARLLAGVELYDFNDGRPNGPDWRPLWKDYGTSTRKWRKDSKGNTVPKEANQYL